MADKVGRVAGVAGFFEQLPNAGLQRIFAGIDQAAGGFVTVRTRTGAELADQDQPVIGSSGDHVDGIGQFDDVEVMFLAFAAGAIALAPELKEPVLLDCFRRGWERFPARFVHDEFLRPAYRAPKSAASTAKAKYEVGQGGIRLIGEDEVCHLADLGRGVGHGHPAAGCGDHGPVVDIIPNGADFPGEDTPTLSDLAQGGPFSGVGAEQFAHPGVIPRTSLDEAEDFTGKVRGQVVGQPEHARTVAEGAEMKVRAAEALDGASDPPGFNGGVVAVGGDIVVEVGVAGRVGFDGEVRTRWAVIDEAQGLFAFVDDEPKQTGDRFGVQVGAPEGGVRAGVFDDRPGITNQRSIEAEPLGGGRGASIAAAGAEDQPQAAILGRLESRGETGPWFAGVPEQGAVHIQGEEPNTPIGFQAWSSKATDGGSAGKPDRRGAAYQTGRMVFMIEKMYKTPTRGSDVAMTPYRLHWLPGLLVLGAVVGCGDPVSVPPVDSGSIFKQAVSEQTGTDVPTVGLVIPDGQDLDANTWEQSFRIRAADRRVFVEVVRTPEGKQAEDLPALAARGVAVAVIVPDRTDEGLAPAIQSLIDRQVPVILLDRGVEGLNPAPPVVRYSPVEDDARALVAAAVEDARRAGFADDAEAVVVTNGPFDAAGRARLAALEEALAQTSLTALPTVRFEGYIEAARQALEPVIKEHPNLAVILAEEEQGATALVDGRNVLYGEQPDRKPYVIAAMGHSISLRRMAETNQFAALAIRDPDRLARRAFDMATAIARGESANFDPVVKTEIIRATDVPDRSEFEAMRALEKLQPVTGGAPGEGLDGPLRRKVNP